MKGGRKLDEMIPGLSADMITDPISNLGGNVMNKVYILGGAQTDFERMGSQLQPTSSTSESPKRNNFSDSPRKV